MAETDDTSPLEPGDLFGDYTVERQLGKGNMGTVYLVRSPDGAPFAVKIMHRGKMSHDLRVRFAREAEFAMEIRHRNLVSVYDVGEDPDTGLCYIIMEYVPGGTLSDRLREGGTIPVGEAVKIAMQAFVRGRRRRRFRAKALLALAVAAVAAAIVAIVVFVA